MEPGTEQTLEVELTNHGEEDKVINVNVATASTNHGGNADYTRRPNNEPDDTLLYQMQDLASTEGRVTIPAQGSVKVPIKVLMPSVPFEGILAGGINFEEEVPKGEEEVTENDGVMIKNEYSYVIALLLRVDETEVKPEMQLNQVYATQSSYRNNISANLQNIKPAFIYDMRIDAKVREKGQKDVVYELEKKGMEMSPNSNFNYLIPLNGEPFEAGTYVLTLSVESTQGNWEFEKEFVISEEDARRFNETDVTIEVSKLWIYIAAGGGILVFIILVFLIVLNRKKIKKQRNRTTKIVEEITSGIKGND
jgi:uncharacterized membrane protein